MNISFFNDSLLNLRALYNAYGFQTNKNSALYCSVNYIFFICVDTNVLSNACAKRANLYLLSRLVLIPNRPKSITFQIYGSKTREKSKQNKVME